MANVELTRLMNPSSNQNIKDFSAKLASDPEFRRSFLENPSEALARIGLKTNGKVQLGPQERALIEIFADPKITDLYLTGDVDALRNHIVDRYRQVAGVSIDEVAGWAVSDFHVAIEAEAVAVAIVAAAATAIGVMEAPGRLRQLEAENGVLNARLTALEARLKMTEDLENRIRSIESRMR
ncbi:hypothetical protein JJE66_14970 [Bradyrhizobium diazoefficiens]|uniref:hypothetical protein n=1 Tax=Bradyrhizobium diazoefficiens TaxID=1355477 RepID=UPI00190E255A|nr:hypothetical protein [Bradyrhizobium diazoefficiens]MBK3662544.1 hypothetical protein [Bradyrhizobium diazoefficiens]